MNKELLLNPDLECKRVSGKDSYDFFNRLTTNKLMGMREGEFRSTLLLDEKARLLDRLFVEHLSMSECKLYFYYSEASIGYLDRFIFTEDIAFSDEHDSNKKWSVEAYKKFRIENLIADRNEFQAALNPLELGLIDDISFTKGCYTGQEVIARLESQKKVSKFLALIESQDKLSPEGNYNILSASEKSLGKVTTVGSDHHHLALIHKSLLQNDSALILVGEDGKEKKAQLIKALNNKSYLTV